MTSHEFDYSTAFSRNIGWLTEREQAQLHEKTVAIAGLGGAGGAHATTLARLGVGSFKIADFDRFDWANFNRQAGATASTIGQPKADVMARMIRDINPTADVTVFEDGVQAENIDTFLSGVDLFVDGLDFFVIDIRRKVFARCAELRIPAITAAPIGFGTGYLIFTPDGMSFDTYFGFHEGLTDEQKYVNFAVGLTPKGFHRNYLVDPSRVDLQRHRGPSTVAAIQLCAGVVAAEAAKILVGRGKVYAAPWYHQFDAYRGRWARAKLRFGAAGPLQRLKRQIGYRAFGRMSRRARPVDEPATGSDIERILDLARWAPSGDNTQPWRFDTKGDDEVVIHVESKSDDVYDYDDGRPTLLATGMLLETMRLASSRFGRAADWSYLSGKGRSHRIAVRMPRRESVMEDQLAAFIPIRSVDRRPYSTRPLSPEQKTELAAALGDELRITWHESPAERWHQAKINALSSDIRLRIPEAYVVHQRVIDWDANFSRTGVPAAAIGLDPVSLPRMRWVMGSWRRVRFFNRFLMGTMLPRIELDLVPGLVCAAHFTITRADADGGPWTPEEVLRAGAAIQRFWLTLTRLGLAMQPALAPVIFGHYASAGIRFTENDTTRTKAAGLADTLKETASCAVPAIVFRGRIGYTRPSPPPARSIRIEAPSLRVRAQWPGDSSQSPATAETVG